MPPKKLFKVVITAIVARGDRYLVIQLPADHKKFPGEWSIPGGKLTTEDYIHLPKDTAHYWYNVLEQALRREVKEEAGIEIKNIRYITSLADAREDDDPSIVISCLADYASGEVVLEGGMQGYRWVTLEEAGAMTLIDGIYDELKIADFVCRGGTPSEWQQS